MAAFALAGIWLVFGIDGYAIISQPTFDAQPNPLAKTVQIGSGAWLSNYSQYPLTLLFPALGFGGVILTILFSKVNRPGWGSGSILLELPVTSINAIILLRCTHAFRWTNPASGAGP